MPQDMEALWRDVPGWMSGMDRWAFRTILNFQQRTQLPGDLVELGAYMGKSAIVIGRHRQSDERFTVCDLFEDVLGEQSIHEIDRAVYSSLTESEFKANYLTFHHELPTIVRGLTSTIADHVEAGTCRFVHIDASHEYDHVRADVAATRTMLRSDGVVAFDDYRAFHTPGTAAAVWESIVSDALHPICLTQRKLYATWGDPDPPREELQTRLESSSRFGADVHRVVRDEPVIRIIRRSAPATPDAPKRENRSSRRGLFRR